MNAIKHCLIVGGTHGNEMSGLVALNAPLQTQLKETHPTLDINFEVGNPRAVKRNIRFTEEDLNRQFTLANLAPSSNNLSYEAQRARELNAKWGPKAAPSTDVVIDIHNTTSNMGPTLIILTLDEFHISLSRYIKHYMPEAVILLEDEKSISDHPYLCTLGKVPLMIEVGAQPQGVCRADISKQAMTLLQLILEFCQHYNENSAVLALLKPTQGFRLTGVEYYPEATSDDSDYLREWMIHPDLQDADFQALNRNQPIFISHQDEVKHWDGATTYPHFINEAAYHSANVAFATSDKVDI